MKFPIGKRIHKVLKKERLISKCYNVKFDNKDFSTDINCNRIDEFGRTALFYATQQGNKKLVRDLLEYGADPDIPDNDLTYPIHEAVDSGNMNIIELLIYYDCDINCKNLLGQTPLIRATLFSDLKAVKVLVQSGADINETDDLGKSALLNGLEEGCDKICCFLIKSGCDVNCVDNIGQSAMYLATSGFTNTSVRQKLLKAGYKFGNGCEWLQEIVNMFVSDTSVLQNFELSQKFMNMNKKSVSDCHV